MTHPDSQSPKEAEGEPGSPGPVPSSPIHEDSITNFDQKTGDSSRGLLAVILVLMVILLLGILIFTESPT